MQGQAGTADARFAGIPAICRDLRGLGLVAVYPTQLNHDLVGLPS
ncbi:MAG: hypothetical protein KatS3mg056_3601 [Chloroflexus sp.]|jgi:hypothetical protein|nr:MAG: hypothetical protein KatS3mg056_3601 [Chloroflexus sp.]